jgi:hypothetical protein
MSCEEEEESSLDEDEDMPGLESVSSSEYVSDEDSLLSSSEGEENPSPAPPVDPKSHNYTTARRWLRQSKEEVMNQLQVITIHLLSPFLYGCSHQTDKWLEWCCKVGLLQSDVNYNTGTLKDVELCAVLVLDRAVEWCKESATKEGKSPTNLAELLQLAEEVKSVTRLSRAMHLARKRPVFITMARATGAQCVDCSDQCWLCVVQGGECAGLRPPDLLRDGEEHRVHRDRLPLCHSTDC